MTSFDFLRGKIPLIHFTFTRVSIIDVSYEYMYTEGCPCQKQYNVKDLEDAHLMWCYQNVGGGGVEMVSTF